MQKWPVVQEKHQITKYVHTVYISTAHLCTAVAHIKVVTRMCYTNQHLLTYKTDSKGNRVWTLEVKEPLYWCQKRRG